MAAEAKQLRLFTTFSADQATEARSPAENNGNGSQAEKLRRAASAARLERLAAGSSSRWSPFYAVSSRHDMATTALLLHCISTESSGSGQLAGYDRDSSRSVPAGSGGSKSLQQQQDGLLATAFAEQLAPGWRQLIRIPGWRWHLQNLLESPCFGVPGLCRYTAARAAWMQLQLRDAIAADACRQVVVLRAGLSTWSHAIAQPGVQFYEVDSRAAVQRKKELLDGALPGWRRERQRPRFVEVDFSGGFKTLITELTGAGFDPSLRCCIIAEGLLAYLSQEQADSLITDLSALCAPGSRFLFDFLHRDALESESCELPGFASLAAAAANKGCPLKGGMQPAFSAMVRYFQPHRFRVAQVLAPAEVAAFWWQQAQQAQQAHKGQQQAGTPSAALPAKRQAEAAEPPSVAALQQAAAAAGRLPYVPEFFGLAAVTKIDSRLLLRRAASGSPAGATSAGDGILASGVSGWVAAGVSSALSSPSCILRSLAFLLWGGSPRLLPPAATSSTTCAASTTAGAAAAPAALLVLPVAPPARQESAEWRLAAVPSQQPLRAPATDSRTASASSSGPSSTFAAAPQPAQPPAAADELPAAAALDRAQSIAARRVPGGAVRCSSEQDAGHLTAPSAEGVASIEQEEEGVWMQNSIFSWSLFL